MNNPFESISSQLNRIEALLTEVRNLQPDPCTKPASDTKTVLNVTQASALLNLKASTVYALVSRSEIPYSKKGNRLYFFSNDLIEWIQSGRGKLKGEVELEAKAYLASRGKSKVI